MRKKCLKFKRYGINGDLVGHMLSDSQCLLDVALWTVVVYCSQELDNITKFLVCL